MRSWKGLVALAMVGAPLAPLGLAEATPDVIPHLTRGNSLAASSNSALDESARAAAAEPMLEGKIAAVNHQTGQLVLDTAEGQIGLAALPEDVQDLQIGDVIRMSLVPDDD
jgi:hypothetical protein